MHLNSYLDKWKRRSSRAFNREFDFNSLLWVDRLTCVFYFAAFRIWLASSPIDLPLVTFQTLLEKYDEAVASLPNLTKETTEQSIKQPMEKQ